MFIYLQVPLEFNAIQTVDLLFKIHMVFNINFESNIAPAMNFLAHFIYGFEGALISNDKDSKKFKPSTKMYEVHNLIEDSRKK